MWCTCSKCGKRGQNERVGISSTGRSMYKCSSCGSKFNYKAITQKEIEERRKNYKGEEQEEQENNKGV